MRIATLVTLTLVIALSASCATTSASTSAATRDARAYFPLAIGNTWQYRITPAPSEKAVEEVRIVDKDDQGFFIDNHGARLAPRTDGVFDGQRFLLQAPVEQGHKWLAVPSAGEVERFEITAVDRRVTVDAGEFEDCVEVQALSEVRDPKGHALMLQMVWTFAPGVGLVMLEQRIREGTAPAKVTTRMELVKFTPAG